MHKTNPPKPLMTDEEMKRWSKVVPIIVGLILITPPLILLVWLMEKIDRL